ncbi:nuclear transport factor 2 family protein [Gordonia sp. OPL2]|uniref:YybH family protein n=1 Tax=Gordonia sp. OPL2 TaxID=2486274 RepID=UPI001654FFCE|nr:nuclear transport factor 2 family protein [Gordonia sp. OPL2]ROZ99080.1 DUF4440 domain-containing protein [Gordonia sp. OPL2]
MTIEDEIATGNKEFCAALGAHDLDGLMACYDDDVVLLLPGVPIIHGADGARAYYDQVMKAGVTGATMTTDTVVERADCVVEVGGYTMDVAPPEGDPVHDAGKYQIVYRRDDSGRLRIWFDMFHSDAAAAN